MLGVAPTALISQTPQEIVLRYNLEAVLDDPWSTTAATPWIVPGQSGILTDF